MFALVRDKRGATVVTYALLFPIFVLLIFGGFEVWKIISIKQSLNAGTYQAARYLSNEGKGLPDDPDDWEAEAAAIAEGIIAQKLGEGFAGSDAAFEVEVTIETPDRSKCEWLFSVRAELPLPWTTVIPYLPSKNMVLVEQHTSYIECTDYWVPPEGHTY